MKTKLIQRASLVTTTFSLALAHAGSVYARTSDQLEGVSLGDNFINFGFNSLDQAIDTLVKVIIFVAGLAAFLFILWGAVSYILAGDDSSKTDAARKKITNAVVGLILVALVYVIWLIAAELLNINGAGTEGIG
jgi:glucose uptake protein GlcU